MSTVVNEDNFQLFDDNGIIPILPRNINLEIRIKYLKMGYWVALGLKEFENLIDEYDSHSHVLIDIANGHMEYLCKIIHEVKKKCNITIMCGNIANPQTYRELALAGADFIRCGIGTGSGCLTWSNTGIGYPIASLIFEIYKIKEELYNMGKNTPLIIADGGIRNYSDVIKALALGADYVMIGGEFAKLVESAAPTFYYDNNKIIGVDPFECKIKSLSDGTFDIDGKIVNNLHKLFYGMASKKGQEELFGNKINTSEGVSKVFDCTTNLSSWVQNMVSYIQSAMSYTNCSFIEDFNPSRVNCVVISQQTKESINK